MHFSTAGGLLTKGLTLPDPPIRDDLHRQPWAAAPSGVPHAARWKQNAGSFQGHLDPESGGTSANSAVNSQAVQEMVGFISKVRGVVYLKVVLYLCTR